MLNEAVKVYCSNIEGLWFCAGLLRGKLKFISFSKRSRSEALNFGLKHLEGKHSWALAEPTETIWNIFKVLHQTYNGSEATFNFNLCWEQVSTFNRRVLELTQHVPRGCLATYGGLARALGVPGASRAVGRALALNPFPLVVPCHRVVRSDLTLGGYSLGLDVKAEILSREGVEILKVNGKFKVKREHLIDLKSLSGQATS